MVRLCSVPATAIVLIVVVVGAVVHVGQLSLEGVEPLPVVDGDGDSKGHDEDGHDDSYCSSCATSIF